MVLSGLNRRRIDMECYTPTMRRWLSNSGGMYFCIRAAPSSVGLVNGRQCGGSLALGLPGDGPGFRPKEGARARSLGCPSLDIDYALL